MHFVITALGSYGDVHPMVGLGVALTRRGHRVSLVANAYFENVVRDAGLDHLLLEVIFPPHFPSDPPFVRVRRDPALN